MPSNVLDWLQQYLASGRPSWVPQGTPSDRAVAGATGMTEPPNIDLNMRPAVPNQGGLSTVYSMGFDADNGRSVVAPGLASDGSRVLTPDEASSQYDRTGQHLGKFDTPANAEAYAQALHEAQAQQYRLPPGMTLPARNVLDWLQQYLGGDPEAQASADASRAMEPVVGPYLAKVASGDVIKESLDNVNAAFANHDYPALAGMFSGAGGGIRAYHGSPYNFNAFDTAKIGTGEGAQAYGHGLYFAENEGVAQQYRNKLAGNNRNATLEVLPDYFKPGNIVPSYGGTRDRVLEYRPEVVPGQYHGNWAVNVQEVNSKGDPIGQPRWHSTLPSPQNIEQVTGQKLGRMYETEINAEPGQFLDWDKELTSQPRNVQDILSNLGVKRETSQEYLGTRIPVAPSEPTGEAIYKRLVNQASPIPLARLDAPRGVSQQLNEAGIPGIRYLDEGSRLNRWEVSVPGMKDPLTFSAQHSEPELRKRIAAMGYNPADVTVKELPGTSNYVVFNDQLIKILRKYGIVPPVAGGALGGLLGEEP